MNQSLLANDILEVKKKKQKPQTHPLPFQSLFLKGSHCVAQISLELVILLPQPFQC